MELIQKILNEGMAWAATVLGIVLAFKYIVRKGISINSSYKKEIINLNKLMRNTHKELGIIMIAAGIIHGIFSSEALFSLNMGSICALVSILLALSYYLRKSFKKASLWIIIHRYLTIVFLATMFIHIAQVKLIPEVKEILYEFQQQQSINNEKQQGLDNKDEVKKEDGNTAENESLKDGVFTGEAKGFNPGLKVSVTIKNNIIESIEIIEHNEKGKSFYGPPIEKIPKSIIEKQSVEVDEVSGATYTSRGIKNAVKDALSKASK